MISKLEIDLYNRFARELKKNKRFQFARMENSTGAVLNGGPDLIVIHGPSLKGGFFELKNTGNRQQSNQKMMEQIFHKNNTHYQVLNPNNLDEIVKELNDYDQAYGRDNN